MGGKEDLDLLGPGPIVFDARGRAVARRGLVWSRPATPGVDPVTAACSACAAAAQGRGEPGAWTGRLPAPGEAAACERCGAAIR